ncbi:MAG: class I adenylate-forming enzyme family protein [Bacillota bacterium]
MDPKLAQNLIQRMAVGDIPRRSARRRPAKEALVEYRGGERRSLTFQQLNEACNRFARAVRSLGLGKGDRVAAICLNSTEFVISIYGLAKGGFVLVPVNPGLSPQEIAYVLNHCEARVLIVDDAFAPMIGKYLEHFPNIKHYISLPVSGQQVEPFVDFNRFIDGIDGSEIEDVVIEDRDILQIMYTSGTTAMPKGVLISNLNVYATALQNTIELQINPDSVVTTMMPIFHCAQHTLLTTCLLAGAGSVVMRGFDPEGVMKVVQAEKVTWLFALPMMYRYMLDHPSFNDYDLSSLQICLYAMTPMDRRTLEDARKKIKAAFILGTGQTEAYPATNYYNPDWYPEKEGNIWGMSSPSYDTAVMDDEGNILPPGQVGEIVWRGPGVMEGYFKDEAATEAARKFGWHHSGDQGYIDEDGMLFFVDRKKDMIKTGGENVPSIKVETVILAHPQVEAAAVIGLPHPHWAEAVTAVVVPKKGSGLTEEDVINWCKKELGGFQVPKSVIFVEDLPRTTTGKIKKHELRKKFTGHYSETE